MHLSSDEEFTCSLTTVIDAKTSVLKSTVANPSPFDSVINCLLPLNVEVGFVALGVTGGQYEGLVQVMFIDPPRATSASPRRSPSEGGGLAWVYAEVTSTSAPNRTCRASSGGGTNRPVTCPRWAVGARELGAHRV